MNILERVETYKSESRVKDAIEKFGMKMKGSTKQTAEEWVDGMGEMTPKEKKQILTGIQKWIEK